MSEELIIDIQGFVGPLNHFQPKEIAVVSVNHPYSEVWMIAPPCKFSELSCSARRQNNWLSRHVHRLSWDEGEIPHHSVAILLHKATCNSSVVYVRGKEKTAYLSKILSIPVINLDHISPSTRHLPGDRNLCLFHGIVACELYDCALQNATKLKEWVTKEKRNPENINFDLLSCNKIAPSDLQRLRDIVDYETSSEEEEEDEGVDEVDFDLSFLRHDQLHVLETVQESAL